MDSPSFRTQEVAQLYEKVKGCCHPEHPFLDANYSPGSCAPAVDFTSIIAEWIRNGKEEAISELWSFLSYEGQASAYALQKALKVRMPSWVKLSETAQSELKAIYLLTLRAKMILPQDISAVSACLAATTLACRQMEIDPAFSEKLLKATRPEIGPNSILQRVEDGAKSAVAKALSSIGAAEPAALKLKVVPPMARAVVFDFFQRDWGHGKFRFDLYWDHRMYGCGRKWNQYYVEGLGFFCPPTDNAAVPAVVTKDLLMQAFEQKGIPCKKTTTRKAMIEQARGIPGFLPPLISSAYPEQQEIRSEWSESVKEWVTRVQYIEPVGAALIKLLGISVLSGT